MRHPVEKYNEEQTRALAAMPDSIRGFWASMFRIGNATYCYYSQAKQVPGFDDSVGAVGIQDELLGVYFEEYLAGLPNDALRIAERLAGLQKAKSSFAFRRYVLERNDIGLDEFLRYHLSAEDYALHRENGKPLDSDGTI